MPLTPISEISEAQLAMVEEMAGTGFSLQEIAEVIEADPTAFQEAFEQKDTEVYRRYRKGYLLAQFQLRKRIFKDAGHGSSPAQTLAKKIMDEAAYKMMHHEQKH